MSNLNLIGLDKTKAEDLAAKLNKLLANYQVFYMNTRGYHWNIKGDDFFELHVKFEELYNDLVLKIDEIAERVVTLGYVPYHSYSEFLTHSEIKEITNVSDGKTAIGHILDGFQKIITKQRELLTLSADADDEGTNSLMSDYVSQQEKLVWMYGSYVSKIASRSTNSNE